MAALVIYFLQEGCRQTRDGLEQPDQRVFSLRNCPLPGDRMQARNIALQ
jgi:hypothetical protein